VGFEANSIRSKGISIDSKPVSIDFRPVSIGLRFGTLKKPVFSGFIEF
jgi:hypothetical protein